MLKYRPSWLQKIAQVNNWDERAKIVSKIDFIILHPTFHLDKGSLQV